jgi:hypothetical protein
LEVCIYWQQQHGFNLELHVFAHCGTRLAV